MPLIIVHAALQGLALRRATKTVDHARVMTEEDLRANFESAKKLLADFANTNVLPEIFEARKEFILLTVKYTSLVPIFLLMTFVASVASVPRYLIERLTRVAAILPDSDELRALAQPL